MFKKIIHFKKNKIAKNGFHILFITNRFSVLWCFKKRAHKYILETLEMKNHEDDCGVTKLCNMFMAITDLV